MFAVYIPDKPSMDNTSISLTSVKANKIHSASKAIDPENMLPPPFQKLVEDYDDVFNPQFNGYSGAVSPFKAVVNMGPTLPPQRKG